MKKLKSILSNNNLISQIAIKLINNNNNKNRKSKKNSNEKNLQKKKLMK